jgi:DNA helicase-2/ATP-dependent DNA helicase PcrA
MMVKYIARKNRIKDQGVQEELENQLYGMMTTCDFAAIYANLYNDEAFYNSLSEEFRSEIGNLQEYQVLPYTWEDGCALAYLRIMLAGLEQPENVFYFFADEAQDLSPIMLSVIKAAYGSADMLFAGDNAQNVFCCGEDYALTLKETFPGKHYKKYELQTNYRSTKEIAEFACEYSGLPKDVACIRRGETPEIIEAEGDLCEKASQWIEKMQDKGYMTAAVICASKREADNIALEVQLPEKMDIELSFLPAYIAKGLEYDCVLVINHEDVMRKKDKALGTNMLYTACTRALHSLGVII